MTRDTGRIDSILLTLLDKLPAALAEELESVRICYVEGLHVNDRAFGRTWTRPVQIEIAVELNDERRAVIRGVLAHELAHALVLLGAVEAPDDWRDLDVVERHADQVAERLFGDKLYYDARGVQCMGKGARGTRPRPLGLR